MPVPRCVVRTRAEPVPVPVCPCPCARARVWAHARVCGVGPQLTAVDARVAAIIRGTPRESVSGDAADAPAADESAKEAGGPAEVEGAAGADSAAAAEAPAAAEPVAASS